MNQHPKDTAAYWKEERDRDVAALTSVIERKEQENKDLRAAILRFTGELTPEQLKEHMANPPYEFSRPDLARLYLLATGYEYL